MKPVVLTVGQWKDIRKQLQDEYPKTVFMLREHKEFISKPDGGCYDFQIHLDFYSENKRTMFLLKFSEVIGNNGKL